MNRREFLKKSMVSAAVISMPAYYVNADKINRPNILWIVADDLGTDLGCYGTKEVYTPHIDQLAAQGARYTHCFTVTAVCSPSRSALITGMYPVSIDCHQHRTKFKKALPATVKPITEYFKAHGYFVTNGSQPKGNEAVIKAKGKEDYNFETDYLYDGTDWRQRREGQPFFSQIQIHYPHRPFISDSEHPVDPDKVRFRPCYPEHSITRMDWALYLETVQEADRRVGMVLKRLDDDGLTDSTIVFFVGDQGRPMLWAKQFLYDEGIRTPLIVRWPGKIKPQSIVDTLISNIDLAAASLTAAGIPVPDIMQGRNFLSENGPERDCIFAMRDRRDSTVNRIRCVRTKDFKYIRNFYPERPYSQWNSYKKLEYPVLTLMQILHKQGKLTPEQDRFMQPTRPPEELYNLHKDPDELQNLADNPAYQENLIALRNKLNQWLKACDKGIYPENQKEIEYWQTFYQNQFRQAMEKRGLSPDCSDEDYLIYWDNRMKKTLNRSEVKTKQK